jgi:aerobic-type carbon monoxide dehydrogenase small subunit (CoxS/CutS family)
MNRITLTVNGVRHVVDVEDETLLLDVLRESVGTTSVREGCGVGACGACTVLSGGVSVSSCLALAVRHDGAELTTAEGLDENDDVVSSFVDCNAAQCGYCIPGFVLMSRELLAEHPHPTEQEITDHLEGNICRCGTYPEIKRAVAAAAERRSR